MSNNIVSMIENIKKYSHIKDEKEIQNRLLNEFELSGINVLDDFYRFKKNYNINYFEYNENMDKFYTQSDGFLFELSAWHCTYERMEWKLNILSNIQKNYNKNNTLKILTIGDGLGFDSLFLYKNLNNIELTYFEFENSKSFNFAKNMFKDKKASILQVGTLGDIKENYYDIVICLEVFEHLPKPKIVIQNIFNYLNEYGKCYISESFGTVELLRPTHLLSNNTYVGRIIDLFMEKSFYFVDRLSPRIYVFTKNKSDKSSFLKYLKRQFKNKLIHKIFNFNFVVKSNEELDKEYLEIKKNIKGLNIE